MTNEEGSNSRKSRSQRSKVTNAVIEEELNMPNVNRLKNLFQANGKIHTPRIPQHTESRYISQQADDKSNDDVDIDNINHTQRFKVTRAWFAKMEEQTLKDRLADNRQLHRSKSPTRYPGTYTRLALSPMNSNSEMTTTDHKFSNKYKPSFSDRQLSGNRDSQLSDNRDTRVMNDRDIRQIDNRDTKSSENVLEAVPNPKWLIQHYEKVTRNSTDSKNDSRQTRSRPQESWSASSTPTQEQAPPNPSWKRTISDSNLSNKPKVSTTETVLDASLSYINPCSKPHKSESDDASNGDNITEKLAAWKSRRRSNIDNPHNDSQHLDNTAIETTTIKMNSNDRENDDGGMSEGVIEESDLMNDNHVFASDEVELVHRSEIGQNKEDEHHHHHPYHSTHTATENNHETLEGEYHMMDNGDYYYEVQGLAEVGDDGDDSECPSKKPSRVRFTNDKIKVFSTYSVEEYDRHNEDVDPMAASAEYELEKRVEKMELFDVELYKGTEGLGFSIIGMGVGADAGLEKLGIFIKTLSLGGAAEKDGRIQVNDQIIEVDGSSLVGVTQLYAATMLRNTSGLVKFVIGREKDAQNSEVARLIQQSIEQDKRRDEMLQQQQQQLMQQKQQQESEYDYQDGDDEGTYESSAFSNDDYRDKLPPRLPGEGMSGGKELNENLDTNAVYMQLLEAQQQVALLKDERNKLNSKIGSVSLERVDQLEKQILLLKEELLTKEKDHSVAIEKWKEANLALTKQCNTLRQQLQHSEQLRAEQKRQTDELLRSQVGMDDKMKEVIRKCADQANDRASSRSDDSEPCSYDVNQVDDDDDNEDQKSFKASIGVTLVSKKQLLLKDQHESSS